jgi:hypothetical protein
MRATHGTANLAPVSRWALNRADTITVIPAYPDTKKEKHFLCGIAAVFLGSTAVDATRARAQHAEPWNHEETIDFVEYFLGEGRSRKSRMGKNSCAAARRS